MEVTQGMNSYLKSRRIQELKVRAPMGKCISSYSKNSMTPSMNIGRKREGSPKIWLLFRRNSTLKVNPTGGPFKIWGTNLQF